MVRHLPDAVARRAEEHVALHALGHVARGDLRVERMDRRQRRRGEGQLAEVRIHLAAVLVEEPQPDLVAVARHPSQIVRPILQARETVNPHAQILGVVAAPVEALGAG